MDCSSAAAAAGPRQSPASSRTAARRGRRRVVFISRSPCQASVVEPDVDGIAPDAESDALALRLELDDHAILVLKPEPAIVAAAQCDARPALRIGAVELADILQMVDIPRRRHRLHAETADAEAADRE